MSSSLYWKSWLGQLASIDTDYKVYVIEEWESATTMEYMVFARLVCASSEYSGASGSILCGDNSVQYKCGLSIAQLQLFFFFLVDC